jgi:hypothetical protein
MPDTSSPVRINAIASCRECKFQVHVDEYTLNERGRARIEAAHRSVLGHILATHSDEKEKTNYHVR